MGVLNGTVTVDVTNGAAAPNPPGHPATEQVTVCVDDAERFAAASTAIALASAVVLLNGDVMEPSRAPSRAASETTLIVSHRRLTSMVANNTRNSAGRMMTNS